MRFDLDAGASQRQVLKVAREVRLADSLERQDGGADWHGDVLFPLGPAARRRTTTVLSVRDDSGPEGRSAAEHCAPAEEAMEEFRLADGTVARVASKGESRRTIFYVSVLPAVEHGYNAARKMARENGIDERLTKGKLAEMVRIHAPLAHLRQPLRFADAAEQLAAARAEGFRAGAHAVHRAVEEHQTASSGLTIGWRTRPRL